MTDAEGSVAGMADFLLRCSTQCNVELDKRETHLNKMFFGFSGNPRGDNIGVSVSILNTTGSQDVRH